MKHNQILTDVRLEVVNEVFHAHKIILAAASPYFKGIFPVLIYDQFLTASDLQQCSPVAFGRKMLPSSSCKEYAPQ